MQTKKVFLVLEDGSSFEGYSFGSDSVASGEVVFQTGVVGYPQSLTDPSYHRQILILTYPLVGNYGATNGSDERDSYGLFKWIESHKIWVNGLVVSECSAEFSHWSGKMTLSQWLEKEGIPGIQGIDTRQLTKKIRDKGSVLGMIVKRLEDVKFDPITKRVLGLEDPNQINLVKEVSTTKVVSYNQSGSKKVAIIDVGVKMNQIRCLISRGLQVDVVPWDFPIMKHIKNYDGVFISNGPGDPALCTTTVDNIVKLISETNLPIFGICLGHQLLARAVGATTTKMLYGNRGHNQPCRFRNSERCFVTSQNHGFAVEASSLPADYIPIFTNVNDDSNEGIAHVSKPIFSVQFHPEHRAGPEDMTFLFDVFTSYVKGQSTKSVENEISEYLKTPEVKISRARKVLILGSGGLSIGQAGEFDYSGSQAIKALKEEGIQTVLINPNIATVQTNPDMANKVYFLPITYEYVVDVIRWERPDGIFLMFGGQTALNCGIELEKQGIFKKFGIQVLGTPIKSIIESEDREQFAAVVQEVGAKTIKSRAARTEEEAVEISEELEYPVLVRAAYALGGFGSGFANDASEIRKLAARCLETTRTIVNSGQVFIDKSLRGWKEVEYEVVRDAYDNCVTVCNMENVDPLGVHTGESIVVAPSQTLTDHEYQMLRTTAIRIAKRLGIIGECNVQYALSPRSAEYYVVEVNARLSRSSALASKATGYPLAYVAAKLALGHSLSSLANSMTQKTACFEPSLDYCVVKIPRWDLGKFSGVSRRIGSSMKSVGEVMAIGRTFEETLQKALRMVDEQVLGFYPGRMQVKDDDLKFPTDKRIFALASAFKAGYSIDKINDLTKIDPWFLHKMKNIIDFQVELENLTEKPISQQILKDAKKLGFCDKQIAHLIGSTEIAVRKLRKEYNIRPFVKQVDTVSAEWPAFTNYLYTTYNGNDDDISFASSDQAVMVLGSGVYRIGSSVEFDCCAVSCVQQLKKMGKSTIMINNNPETVSTDYDMCDKLYFEEISFEVVMDLYELEKPLGIILSVGGQLSNNIAMDLHRQNAAILGTQAESIDGAENRFKFSRMLDKMAESQTKISQPEWKELTSFAEAKKFCVKVGYPCIVRPSFVLSGANMEIIESEDNLEHYLKQTETSISKDHPVVISKFIQDAKEIDVDVVSQNGEIVCLAVSEHFENAGVHSGDASLVTPPQDLNLETLARIRYIITSVAKELNVNGPFNMQLLAKDNEIRVIEVNLRVSRSFPFVSKTLGYDFVAAATRVMLGERVTPVDVTFGYQSPLSQTASNRKKRVGVKVAQFSFSRLAGADFALGVEMASTGEVACFGENRYEAYLKALLSTGFRLPRKRGNILLSIGSFKHKTELIPSVEILHEMGFRLFGSMGTADFYKSQNPSIPVTMIEWPFAEVGSEETSNTYIQSIADFLAKKDLDLVINLPMRFGGRRRVSTHGYRTRRFAVDFAIPLIADVKCAKLFVHALKMYSGERPPVKTHIDCLTSQTIVRLPGLIDVHVHFREPGQTHKEDFDSGSSAALAGGITVVCVMPNTDPSIVNLSLLEEVRLLAQKKSKCDFGLFVKAEANNSNEWANINISDKPPIALKIYMNDTFSKTKLTEMVDLVKHLETWPKPLPICVHAEGLTSAGIILLARLFQRSLHICHVSRQDEIEVIKIAKSQGYEITCEVTPHHLFLCEDDIAQIGMSRSSVRPVLTSKKDQMALWANLDIIDCFASDHAPHLIQEKDKENPSPGFPGVDTMLPLLLNAVNEKRLTLDDVIDKLYYKPKEIFNIPDQVDTFIEVDMDEVWTIGERYFSRAKWSPFAGRKIKGKVRRVVLRGELAFVDDQILLPPGFGKEIRPTIVGEKKIAKATPQIESEAEEEGSSPVKYVSSPEKVRHGRLRAESESGTDNRQSRREGFILSSRPTEENQMRPLEIDTDPSLQTLYVDPLLVTPNIKSTSLDKLKELKEQPILKASLFTKDILRSLFDLALSFKNDVRQRKTLNFLLQGKVMASLFFEASTRTSCSFSAAMYRLGGQVVSVAASDSSLKKGESIEDTVSTLSCYCDCLVIRHPEPGVLDKLIKRTKKPIINAGDGIGEHPTQALLDIFTIREEKGTVNKLVITLVGDLLNGRTVHSLAQLLTHYEVQLRYVSPDFLKMPRDVFNFVAGRGIEQIEYSNLEDALADTDVIYMTRIQKERFTNMADYEKACNLYCITPELMNKAKEKCVVLHPLPRNTEISPDFDNDPRAAYFRQMENGMYVRMAILAAVLADKA